MKKTLISSIMLFVLVAAVQATIELSNQSVIITGVYAGMDTGVPENHSFVTTTCFSDPNGVDVLASNSNDTGDDNQVSILFFNSTCPINSYVQSCVGSACSSIGVVQARNSHFPTATLRVFRTPPGVPEFSVIAAGLAGIGATAGFLFLRKRN